MGVWGLENDGTVIPGFPLPIGTPGVRAAPTLADLDGDGDLEILASTRNGQVFVWDTSTSYNAARMPWPMGRHDLRRSATYVRTTPDFSRSNHSATPAAAHFGETTQFRTRIQIASDVAITYPIRLTNTLPAGVSYIPGTLTATLGTVTDTTGVLQWSGVPLSTPAIDVMCDVVVDVTTTQIISNSVMLDTAVDGLLTRTGCLYANGFAGYCPLILRDLR